MSVDYGFYKGIDLPSWQSLAFFPAGPSYHGTSKVYDGKRYLYWVVQYVSTATSAATSQLWRYDTWSNGWQQLATITSGNQGMDIEYDSIRNVLYILHGAGLTSWQVFNLNTTSVTIAGVTCAAFALTTMTPVLPAAANAGSTFNQPSDDGVATPVDDGIAAATGNTTTVVVSTVEKGTFGAGMVNLQLRVTSGTQSGQIRTISGVTAPTSITVTPALPGALAAGDTYVIEQVEDVITAGTTTGVTDSTANWTVNAYANMDIIMKDGPAAGQRRRIASNTATAITLSGAVTGNARTGAFTVSPAAGNGFKIVPSSDFLYYQNGGGTGFNRIDLSQTTGAAWASLAALPAATGGGANTFFPGSYAPYSIIAVRGAATANAYQYNIGTNTWSTFTVFAGVETITTGASVTMITGKRKLLIQKEGATRLYAFDLLTGILEPCGTMPYAAAAAYDGKRASVITSPNGAQFLYIMRAGGQEFYRVPLEWL